MVLDLKRAKKRFEELGFICGEVGTDDEDKKYMVCSRPVPSTINYMIFADSPLVRIANFGAWALLDLDQLYDFRLVYGLSYDLRDEEV